MGRRSIKDLRQQEIVKALYKTAKSEGLHNASIAKVADEMNVNPSLILHYFKTKEEMLFALIEYILNRYQNIYTVKNHDSAIEELTQVLNNLFSRKWNKLISDDVYYNCYTLIFRDPKIREKYKQLHDSLRSSLEQHLIACINEGSLKIDNPKITSNLIYTILEGAYFYLCMVNDKDKNEAVMEQYKQHAFELLGIEYVALVKD